MSVLVFVVFSEKNKFAKEKLFLKICLQYLEKHDIFINVPVKQTQNVLQEIKFF